jgi:glucose/arabinose dehydrogenase
MMRDLNAETRCAPSCRNVLTSMLVIGLACAALMLGDLASAQARLEPVAENLASPTNLAFAPDGRILFTEQQTGRVRALLNGRLVPRAITQFDVVQGAETGLLGIALHPNFARQPWVYVYLSSASSGRNEIVRFRIDEPATTRETLFQGLPTVNGYHNGGDLVFGSDGALYVVTGEAHQPELAQDPSSVGGKILRLLPDGSIPPDNPFGAGDPVYALGIRNSFGLCFDPRTGDLWETENGPDRDDEVNRVEQGGNLGWPEELGRGTDPRFIQPELVFPDIIVPTGCAFSSSGRAMYFGDFAGGDLHRATMAESGGIAGERVIARAPAGITDVARAPTGDVYVATSDSILRLASTSPETASPSSATPTPSPSPGGSGTGSRAAEGSSGVRTAIVVGLVVLLAAGLVARALAGRRLRRQTRGR